MFIVNEAAHYWYCVGSNILEYQTQNLNISLFLTYFHVFQSDSIWFIIISILIMKVDTKKCADLATGTIGIYLIYCIASVLQEWIMKKPYVNRFTGDKQFFVNSNAFILVPSLISWMNGWILNRNNKNRTVIPKKNLFYCSGLIMLTTICFTEAIYVTSFPIVMMFKSCNILSVIFVGIFCSRVRDKQQKLGTKKLISGIAITIGILTYNFGGTQKHIQQATNYWGIALLMISLVCDGFLPDFQAEIKEKYKPSALQLFQDTNRWKVFLAGAYSLASLQFLPMLLFFWEHPICLVHIIVLGSMGSIGQMLVFWMIKLFRQHTVPFIITTRKIATVLISIIFFNHQFRILQLFGILIVFGTVVHDFSVQITKEHSTEISTVSQRINNIGQSERIMIDDEDQGRNEQRKGELLK